MPRLFAGIVLPDEIKDRLSALARPLPGAAWVDDDDFHITLRFAGDIEGLVAREFTDLLGEIEVDAFELYLDGLGVFGGKEPRSIWVGVSPTPRLDQLARACDRAARNAGLPPAPHPFKAHVTIARLRHVAPETIAKYLGDVGAFRTASFTVEQFVLYSSKPRTGGGPYVVEAEYPLLGGYGSLDGDVDIER